MSLDEASGDELKAFWEKHAQMKQELGTQVSTVLFFFNSGPSDP